MDEKSKDLFDLINRKIHYFESRFNVHPNIIKLSPDVMNLLELELVLYLRTPDTIFGINLEIDSSKINYLKVGYME